MRFFHLEMQIPSPRRLKRHSAVMRLYTAKELPPQSRCDGPMRRAVAGRSGRARGDGLPQSAVYLTLVVSTLMLELGHDYG